MKTSQLRAVGHSGNLNGYGLGTVTVDETTGQVTFGTTNPLKGLLETVPWALVVGGAAVAYFLYTKLTRGRY